MSIISAMTDGLHSIKTIVFILSHCDATIDSTTNRLCIIGKLGSQWSSYSLTTMCATLEINSKKLHSFIIRKWHCVAQLDHMLNMLISIQSPNQSDTLIVHFLFTSLSNYIACCSINEPASVRIH